MLNLPAQKALSSWPLLVRIPCSRDSLVLGLLLKSTPLLFFQAQNPFSPCGRAHPMSALLLDSSQVFSHSRNPSPLIRPMSVSYMKPLSVHKLIKPKQQDTESLAIPPILHHLHTYTSSRSRFSCFQHILKSKAGGSHQDCSKSKGDSINQHDSSHRE